MYVKAADTAFKFAPIGSTLMCIEGGSAGRKKTKLLQKVAFVNKLCCFSPTEIDGTFLYYWICSPNFEDEFRQHITGLIGGVSISVMLIPSENTNTDKFELRLKNYLQTIMPRIPNCRFRFLPIEGGKYVVIILVHHDAFSPYLHLENQKDYRVYRRVGNDKRTVAYTELKTMFIQSTEIEKEVEQFRRDRCQFFFDQGYKRFMLIHIIPDTFTDSSYNKPVYVINVKNNNTLSGIFSPFNVYYRPFPSADGFYRKMLPDFNKHECRLFNNFIAEAFDTLENEVRVDDLRDSVEHFPWKYIWDKIRNFVWNYSREMEKHLVMKRFFVLISIIGCKGVRTELSYESATASSIDRDKLFITPCVYDNIIDDNAIDLCTKRLLLEYMLALSMTANNDLKKLLKEFA